MTSSCYLAFLFGTYIVTISIPMIWKRDSFIQIIQDYMDNAPLIFLTGILTLMGGISVISFHNIWAYDWRLLITLFGWIATLKSIVMIIAPKPAMGFARFMLKRPMLINSVGVTYFMLGAFLLSRALL